MKNIQFLEAEKKMSSSLNGRAIKALTPHSSLMAVGTLEKKVKQSYFFLNGPTLLMARPLRAGGGSTRLPEKNTFLKLKKNVEKEPVY